MVCKIVISSKTVGFTAADHRKLPGNYFLFILRSSPLLPFIVYITTHGTAWFNADTWLTALAHPDSGQSDLHFSQTLCTIGLRLGLYLRPSGQRVVFSLAPNPTRVWFWLVRLTHHVVSCFTRDLDGYSFPAVARKVTGKQPRLGV